MMNRRSKKECKGGPRRDPEQVALASLEVTNRQARTFKRVLISSSSISTTAGGVIGVDTLASSSNVTVASNWADFEGIALEYRVLVVEAEIFPIVTSCTSPTVPSPTMLAMSAWSSDIIPSSWNAVAQGPGAKLFLGNQKMKFAASAKDYPNVKLWTGITATIATANIYGIMFADPGTAPISVASTPYFRVVVRYLVEFRSFN